VDLTTQKQKILNVSSYFFLEYCKHGFKGEIEVINPIPEDSTLIRVIHEPVFGNLCFVIHSESFPALKDGDKIPEIEQPLFNKVK
jgi:hypothetical protein